MQCADAINCQYDAGSYDVIFSNWLLMYLADEEISNLAAKMLTWVRRPSVLNRIDDCPCLRLGCHRIHSSSREASYFFESPASSNRETRSARPIPHTTGLPGSCVCPCADCCFIPRPGAVIWQGDRNPRQYFAFFDAAEVQLEDGTHATFKLEFCRCVDSYVKMKHNQNQLCWKLTKVLASLHLRTDVLIFSLHRMCSQRFLQQTADETTRPTFAYVQHRRFQRRAGPLSSVSSWTCTSTTAMVSFVTSVSLAKDSYRQVGSTLQRSSSPSWT